VFIRGFHSYKKDGPNGFGKKPDIPVQFDFPLMDSRENTSESPQNSKNDLTAGPTQEAVSESRAVTTARRQKRARLRRRI